MLTSSDIKKLISVMKEFFYTKEEIDEKFLKSDEKFSQLQTTVDGIARDNKIFHEEMAVMGYRVSRHDKWIQKAAPKVGIKYDV